MRCDRFASQQMLCSMILIFDLDDTLYDERTYVESGLRAVADFGQVRFGWEATESFRFMREVLEREGRGKIFDLWLADSKSATNGLVAECVRVYRHHFPKLTLAPEAKELLTDLSGYPLYIVTDGHKIVQQRKVEALGIAPLFRRVLITHRFGVRHAKPSTHCFEVIRRTERCDWSEMIYIGDNPAKDFVGLTALGVHTVRVLTGVHAHTQALAGFEAQHRIADLSAFRPLLMQIEAERPSGGR